MNAAMKRLAWVLSFMFAVATLLLTATPAHAVTIIGSKDRPASELAEFVAASGLGVENAQRSGTVYEFEGGGSLGIESGIVLDTSGSVDGSAANDPNLATLVNATGYSYGGSTSTLSFQMTATGTLLNFNYVFASAEFDQNAKYNDIFGLFVSVNGGAYENIAKITRSNGSLVDVNITNLRAGVSGTEMSNGTATSPLSGTHSLFSNTNISGLSGSTNGVSIVFNAQKEVPKGATIRIKFGICDVSDTSVDSYVFIEAHSIKFDTPGAKPDYFAEELWDLKPNQTYEISDGTNTFTLTTIA